MVVSKADINPGYLGYPPHTHTDTPHKFCRVLFAAKQDEGFHTAQILVQLRAE